MIGHYDDNYIDNDLSYVNVNVNGGRVSTKTECEEFCQPVMTKENKTVLPQVVSYHHIIIVIIIIIIIIIFINLCQEIVKTPTPMVKTTTTTMASTSQKSSTGE